MSIIYERINVILKNRKIPIVELSSQIGVSADGLRRTFKDQTLSVEKLELISKFLNVSPSIWWIENDQKFWVEEPISHYNVNKSEDDKNVVNSLINQVAFLNGVVGEQLIIIKNLSKK